MVSLLSHVSFSPLGNNHPLIVISTFQTTPREPLLPVVRSSGLWTGRLSDRQNVLAITSSLARSAGIPWEICEAPHSDRTTAQFHLALQFRHSRIPLAPQNTAFEILYLEGRAQNHLPLQRPINQSPWQPGDNCSRSSSQIALSVTLDTSVCLPSVPTLTPANNSEQKKLDES